MATNHEILVDTLPQDNERSYKYYLHRLSGFATWLKATGREWDTPDLAKYREHLLNERQLAPSTVNSHLSSIRTRYRALLKDGTLRAVLQQALKDQDAVDYALDRIRSELSDRDVLLKDTRTEPDHVRLKAEHILQLLRSPNCNTFVGLRDLAVMAFLFTTGVREFELCALQVEDLRHNQDGQLALHVPPGRGCTERLVVYDGLLWGLEMVETWLKEANITEGPAFRGFFRGGRVVRKTGLSVRAVEYILSAYPIDIEGQKVTVTAMDLRRAYARLLFEAGVELDDIKANLGLKDSNALVDYIGGSDASLEMPHYISFFDVHTLGL